MGKEKIVLLTGASLYYEHMVQLFVDLYATQNHLFPMHRYQAGDSSNRLKEVTTFMRIEHGSRHALSMTVALACAQGPNSLQSQVGLGFSLRSESFFI
eukprot:1141879-Pelagomonas_calceolata.AAC.3